MERTSSSLLNQVPASSRNHKGTKSSRPKSLPIATIKFEVEQQPLVDELPLYGADNEVLMEAKGISATDNEG